MLTAPAGHSLTMTVNGVETGQRLVATSAADTAFVPGSWRGDIVLTVTTAYDVPWQQHTYPFRQAIYADADGLVAGLLRARGGRGRQGRRHGGPHGVRIASTGECFDGVVVNGGSYRARRRGDHPGPATAAATSSATARPSLANDAGTRVVVDGAVVSNHGMVRTAAIADNGATLVVKNSSLSVRNGVLPSDYIPTVNLDKMEDAPWMLGLNGAGNVRATNLLGNNSIAAYVNSSVTSESWGVLSTDSGTDCTLVAVNSVVGNTGDSGYGTYVIGNATEYLLGTQFDVGHLRHHLHRRHRHLRRQRPGDRRGAQRQPRPRPVRRRTARPDAAAHRGELPPLGLHVARRRATSPSPAGRSSTRRTRRS